MTRTVLCNAVIFDGIDLIDETTVVIEGDRIVDLGAQCPTADHRLDLAGCTVMPGLIDAHFHAYGVDIDVPALGRLPNAVLVCAAKRALEDTLQRGFTTVRDVAGGDMGLAAATARGLIDGPRFVYGGRALSQTGGHGDFRAPTEEDALCLCGLGGGDNPLAIRVDGPDDVRRHIREAMRMGASHIKLFVSGGVFSPSDPIWMRQYSDAEISAAVDEAGARRGYVTVHAHTSEAIRRAVELGVRCVEHATMLDEPTAAFLATRDVFVVPTLAIMDAVLSEGRAEGLSAALLAKADEVSAVAMAAFARGHAHGLKVGFGTDLLGKWQRRQGREFVVRATMALPRDILQSATSVNAALLGRGDELGRIARGSLADIIAVAGHPLERIEVMERLDQSVRLVIKGGEIKKWLT